MFSQAIFLTACLAMVLSNSVDEESYFHSEEYKAMAELKFKHYIEEMNRQRGLFPKKEVCYDTFGCFNNEPPYDNAMGNVPEDPAAIQTKFLLYTRNNPDTYEMLSYNDPSTILSSNFDGSKKTSILIHGFSGHGYMDWVQLMKDGALNKEDINFVVVDWERGADSISYWQGVANCRIVGAEIAYLIKQMNSYAGTSEKQFHLIGFSLGAHVAGYAGEELPGIAHITGLDPASPWFEGEDPRVCIDATDADFVDVIHTNTGNMWLGYVGISQKSGHVDVFPNGGSLQTGCKTPAGGAIEAILTGNFAELFDIAGCNHYRAVYLYANALHTQCGPKSFGCDSYDSFQAGRCAEIGKTEVGNAEKFSYRGDAYCDTLTEEDGFCGFHYHVGISLAPWSFHPDGDIFATVISSTGAEIVTIQLANGESIPAGQETAGLFFTSAAVKDVSHVKLSYEKGWFEYSSFDVIKISVRDYDNDSWWTSCNEVKVQHDNPITVAVTPGNC